jgi:hypothetical protein
MFLIEMLLYLQTNQCIAFASQIIIAHVVCRIIVFGVMPVTEKVLFVHYPERVITFLPA